MLMGTLFLQELSCFQAGADAFIMLLPTGNPSASSANATIAVIKQNDVKNAKKAAQKAIEFNKAFGGKEASVV